MTDLDRLWELSDRISTLERELRRVEGELTEIGKSVGRHIHVICPSCRQERPGPVPGDAICDCGMVLPHTPEVITNEAHRAAAP